MESKKKKVILIVAAVAVIIAGIFIAIMFSTSAERQFKKQMALGEKYYLELNYEQAILCYEEALSLEPENVAIYLALGKIYVETEQYEKALQVLDAAYAYANDEEKKSIDTSREEINVILNPPISDVELSNGGPLEEDAEENLEEEAENPFPINIMPFFDAAMSAGKRLTEVTLEDCINYYGVEAALEEGHVEKDGYIYAVTKNSGTDFFNITRQEWNSDHTSTNSTAHGYWMWSNSSFAPHISYAEDLHTEYTINEGLAEYMKEQEITDAQSCARSVLGEFYNEIFPEGFDAYIDMIKEEEKRNNIAEVLNSYTVYADKNYRVSVLSNPGEAYNCVIIARDTQKEVAYEINFQHSLYYTNTTSYYSDFITLTYYSPYSNNIYWGE